MNTLFTAPLAAVCASGLAVAQPSTAIRFDNGTNSIAAAPGSAVPISIYATGLPALGKPIWWWPGNGPSYLGQYAGFLSVLMDMNAVSGSPVAWSNLTIPPGMGYAEPPFTTAGTPQGSSVHGINIGVGFNPPVTGHEFLLWRGTITVGTSNVALATELLPTASPPRTGFEIAVSGIIPGLNVSDFMDTLNGVALITVPAPAAIPVTALVCLLVARRRR